MKTRLYNERGRVNVFMPQGNLYINEITKENSIAITDISSYDEFIEEVEYFFKNFKCDKIIYKDKYKQYEILRKEYEKIKR